MEGFCMKNLIRLFRKFFITKSDFAISIHDYRVTKIKHTPAGIFTEPDDVTIYFIPSGFKIK